MVGYFFIVIFAGNLSVHLTLIGQSIVQDLIEKIKGWHVACKRKREEKKKEKNLTKVAIEEAIGLESVT